MKTKNKNTQTESETSDTDSSFSDSDESEELNRVQIKMPLELSLSDLANAILEQNQKYVHEINLKSENNFEKFKGMLITYCKIVSS